MPWSGGRGEGRGRAFEAGRERGGPEAVAGRDEADAGVGGVHARVQPADQQAHPGADGVGQRRCPASPDREGRVPADVVA